VVVPKVSFYAHDESAVGRDEKDLLHGPEEQERIVRSSK
jgi:hypothetical protein